MSAEASSSSAQKRSKKNKSRPSASNDAGSDAEEPVSKKQKHRKDKPWDTDDIDHWSIEPMHAPAPDSHRPFTEESSFALLFPKYREPYLRSIWGSITKSLDSVGLACELDLVQGRMTVKTTRKTWDPYVVLKGRDVLKLLARGVAAPQALKVLQDDIACDVIKIGGLVRNKDKFVKRRQRIVGPNGSTLKGNTVSAMGTYKGLKEVRRIVIDCMNNRHPIYRIKELMVRRELARNPQLANENWERFLPKFPRKHLKTSEKTARKNAALERKAGTAATVTASVDTNGNTNGAERLIAPLPTTIAPSVPATTSAAPGPSKPKKKVYTPFPPPQQPSKIDLQLASGEYFLKPKDRESIVKRKKEEQQADRATEKRVQREEAFVAPTERREETVKEKKRKRKEREEREARAAAKAGDDAA